mmetsp:Transcript_20374/g.48992  ORF Transcript_20374/g.48992 Transcript_20374/m.48992 type:complete len:223 (-) Transcript_20374:243-911(-)
MFQSSPSDNGKPPISVEWKPYIIDPNTKNDGEEFEAYNVRRWGSSGWTHGLKRSGRKVGANFANWQTWPNTLRAHQLIAYVTDPRRRRVGGAIIAQGGGDDGLSLPSTSECNSAIFESMYERGANVSSVETLIDIATRELGVTEGEVSDLRSHLENNVGAKDVMKEIQLGRRRYGIKGVPFFVVESSGDGDGAGSGRPYGFSGAQDPSAFVEIFEELAGSSS